MADSNELIAALSSGPLPAAELLARLGVSRATLSRMAATAPDAVVRLGAARATRYAARRSVRGRSEFAIYRVDEEGRISEIGALHPVLPNGYLVRLVDYPDQDEFFEGLPWWLQDMRPQGFLGRGLAHRLGAALGLPADLRLWNDDHALIALADSGEDCVGNLLVGNTALEHFLNSPERPVVTAGERHVRYPELAAAALAGEAIGSSAGGEQPKFPAVVEEDGVRRAVLVKFSAAHQNAVSRRWASLLVAEHLALEALRAAGLPASGSELLFADGQVFLQVERFDRLPARAGSGPRLGRRGLVSLAALDDAFVGRAEQSWPLIAAELIRQDHIASESQWQIERLYAFGRLIGNTDMHRGNLSFLHLGSRPLVLAPAYDMLPMCFAPRSSGQLIDAPPSLAFATPPPLDAWREMSPVAIEWWRRVQTDVRIDEALRSSAAQALEALERLSGLL